MWNRESLPKIKRLLQKSSSGFSQFEAEEFKEKDAEESDGDVMVKEDSLEATGQVGIEEMDSGEQQAHSQPAKEEMCEKETLQEDSDEQEAPERVASRHVTAREAREALLQPAGRKESEEVPPERLE